MKNNIKKIKNGKFSLKYFILNTNTLILYREILKYAGKIKDSNVKGDLRNHIRSEFLRDVSGEYNEKTAEYKLAIARKNINRFKEQVDMLNN